MLGWWTHIFGVPNAANVPPESLTNFSIGPPFSIAEKNLIVLSQEEFVIGNREKIIKIGLLFMSLVLLGYWHSKVPNPF